MVIQGQAFYDEGEIGCHMLDLELENVMLHMERLYLKSWKVFSSNMMVRQKEWA